MDDRSLRTLVEEELDFEPSVDSTDIGVAVDNGIVTLAGFVRSFAERTAAEHAVQRVKGVRGIAQELAIRFPGHKHTADDEIAARAIKIIDWDTTIPDEGIQVKVQKGWVTLTGEVEWGFQRSAAEKAVRKLSGVVGITNAITIRPKVAAIDVRERIEQALNRNAALEANNIRVEVTGGHVKLWGKVNALYDRTLAETAAWAAPGVTEVEDHLTIG